MWAGGGWPQKKKKGYFKLSQWWVISNQHYTSTGGIDPNGTRAIFNTSIYGEYGITDRLTGILYFPFFSRTLVNERVGANSGMLIKQGDAINSLGDTDISLKYGLITEGPIVMSVSATFGLPLGNDSGGFDGTLQTGDGEFNQMLSVDISGSIKVGGAYPYWSVNTGYNNRTGHFSDEFRYSAEVGITVKKWIAIARLTGTKSMNNGDNAFNNFGTSVFANNSEFVSISPELGYYITDKLGVTANYATAFYGKNIFANPSYSVGVFLKL